MINLFNRLSATFVSLVIRTAAYSIGLVTVGVAFLTLLVATLLGLYINVAGIINLSLLQRLAIGIMPIALEAMIGLTGLILVMLLAKLAEWILSETYSYSY